MTSNGLGGLNPLHAAGLAVGTHFWRDDLDRQHQFGIHHIDADLPFENVIYVFVQQIMGQYRPIYWGMAQNVALRFANHHKIEAARRAGANEVHILHLRSDASRKSRNALEMSFLRANPSPLNETGNVHREIANALMVMGQRPAPPIHSAYALAAFLQSESDSARPASYADVFLPFQPQAGFAKSPPPFNALVPGAEPYPLYKRGRSPLDDVV